jgi:hypothetical protein
MIHYTFKNTTMQVCAGGFREDMTERTKSCKIILSASKFYHKNTWSVKTNHNSFSSTFNKFFTTGSLFRSEKLFSKSGLLHKFIIELLC